MISAPAIVPVVLRAAWAPPRPAITAHPADVELTRAAGHYATELGWDTKIIGTQLMLLLRHGTVAVSMAIPPAMEVARALDRHRVRCPITALPGARPMWAFIVRERPQLPRPNPGFAALVHRGTRIPLPPTRCASNDRLKWIVRPDGTVPTLDTITGVIHSLTV